MIVFDANIQIKSATTQYRGFDFNSMVYFAGKYFAAGDDGLYEISENVTDNVEMFFEPVTTDFGINTEKRLRAVYIGIESNADMTLEVSTELGYYEAYTIPASTEGLKTRKVSLSRGVRGRYITFRVLSNGVPFKIDRIDGLLIVRGHGADRS